MEVSGGAVMLLIEFRTQFGLLGPVGFYNLRSVNGLLGTVGFYIIRAYYGVFKVRFLIATV